MIGEYPYDDSSTEKSDLEWIVIAKSGNELLLTTRQLIDNQVFDDATTNVSYKDSHIREWLNDDFMRTAFDGMNTQFILDTIVDDDISDKIFLLNEKEAQSYFANDIDRAASATNYAKNVSNGGSKLFVGSNGNTSYWLRDVANNRVSIVSNVGSITKNLMLPNIRTVGVRPAMWINQELVESTEGKLDIYYGIDWNLDGGQFKSTYKKPTRFKYGEGLTLPGKEQLTAPHGKVFDYWTTSEKNERTTVISSESNTHITVTAHWANMIDEGQVIIIGEYPQEDNNDAKQDLEWVVVHSDEDRVLLTTKYIIDNQSYNDVGGNVQYENSSIRTWLNKTFVDTAFTHNEIDKVLDTQISENVKDKIFIMSNDEMHNYYQKDPERIANATDYAKAVNNHGSKLKVAVDGNSDYWLRDRIADNKAIVVSHSGRITIEGVDIDNRETGVRPAMWMDQSDLIDIVKPQQGNDPENPIIYYDIRWNLGDGAWIKGFKAPGKYRKGEGLDIPGIDKLVLPAGRLFAYWSSEVKYDGRITRSLVYGNKIDKNTKGPIVLTTNWTRNVQILETESIGKYANYKLDDNVDIDWFILGRDGDKALVTTKYGIDAKPFDNKNVSTTWANSSIRDWLNHDFYDTAFTDYEKQYILKTNVPNRSNSQYNTDSGADTEDKIFLLSEEEVKTYFIDLDTRKARSTTYARKVEGSEVYFNLTEVSSNYWLRTMGEDQTKATYVNELGSTVFAGDAITSMKNAVRPAMWVDINRIVMKPTIESSSDDELLSGDRSLEEPTRKTEPQVSTESSTTDTTEGSILDDLDNPQRVLEDLSYKTGTGIRFALFWKFNGGHFKWDDKFTADDLPFDYTVGVGYTFPDPAIYVAAPEGYEFAYYSLDTNYDGIQDTFDVPGISPEMTGGMIAKLNWRRKVDNGEVITLGEYSQDDEEGWTKEPIEWIVLGKENGKILVTSKEIIDNKSFNNTKVPTNWNDTSIRTWLNNDFYEEAFSDGEKERISTDSDANGDKVFLLTEEMAERYFTDDVRRTAFPTKYAQNVNNNGTKLEVNDSGNSPYWLKDMTADHTKALNVEASGKVGQAGIDIDAANQGVRPVLWLKEHRTAVINDITGNDSNKRVFYDITWNMDNKGTWANTFDIPTKYEKGTEYILPGSAVIVPKEGYKFDYWSVDGSRVVKIDSATEGPVVIKANWKEVKKPGEDTNVGEATRSNITWELQGGRWHNYVASNSYIEGVETKLPTNDNIKKTNYVIQGWHINHATATVSSISAEQTGDITLTAAWVSNKFKATFNTGEGKFADGSTQIVKDVTYGDKLADIYPADPIKANTTFVGWRVNGLVSHYQYYEFTQDMTFTAVFADIRNKVILKAGVGEFANGRKEQYLYMTKDADTAIFEVPTAEGYDFDDFYIGDQRIERAWSIMRDEVVTVEARFIPHTYKIIYEGGGATGGMMPVQIATYGEPVTLLPNQYTRDGYLFSGWDCTAATGRYFVDEQDEIYNLTSVDNGEVRMSALWLGNGVVISYKGNGATDIDKTKYNRVTNKEIYEGIFGAAMITVDDEDYSNDDEVFGASAQKTMADTKFMYNTVGQYLTPNYYIRDGYQFIGWGLSPDSTVAYADGAEITAEEMYQKEIVLYALWRKKEDIKASIYIDAGDNGATVNGSDYATIYGGIDEVVPKPSMYKRGYKFDYWTDSVTGKKVEFPEVFNFEGQKGFKANWKPITYTVRFYDDFGENKYTEMEMTYDEAYFVPTSSVVSRPNVELIGWSKLKPNKYRIYKPGDDWNHNSTTTKQGDIINLYAMWNTKNYTIKLHDVDPYKHTDKEQQFVYGNGDKLSGINETVATINNAASAFSGWATEPNSTVVKYYDADLADRVYYGENKEVIDLYPVWSAQNNVAYIIFDAAGGTVKGSPRITVATEVGKDIVYPSRDSLKKSGYVLKAAGDWVDENGNVFNQRTATTKGEIHLYANWDQQTYTIEYIGTGDGVIANNSYTVDSIGKQTAVGGEQVVISNNRFFDRPGHNFLGWDTDVSATTVVYREGEQARALGDAGEVVKLYSVWQPRIYVIKYLLPDEDIIVGTNSFLYSKNVRLLGMTGITEDTRDAGYTYEINGEKRQFSSGQSINADDLSIKNKETEEINRTFALDQNNYHTNKNVFGAIANIFGIGIDTDDIKDEGHTVFGDIAPTTVGEVVMRGNKTKAVYEVSFDANGGQFPDGTTLKTATISTGDRMSTKWPQSPTSTTLFAGWAAVEDDGTEVEYTDETYIYHSGVRFKAKWSTGYIARLLANGGIFADGSDTQLIPMEAHDSTAIFEIPVRIGHEFDHYYVRDNVLATTWNYYANPITDVVAHWKPYHYSIVYDANGGLGYMNRGIATYGEAYKLAANEYVKDGYRFDGWDVNGTTMQPDDEVLNLSQVNNDVIVIRAKWAPLTYDIQYYANGGTGVMAPEIGVIYGTNHQLKTNTFTKENAEFRGWALASSSEVIYFDKATLSETRVYTQVLELYAKWLDNSERYGVLKLYGNTGSINGTSYQEIPLAYNEPINQVITEKLGYNFTYWTNETGVQTPFPTVCNFTEMTLYANWSPIHYNVRYYANGGVFSNGSTDYVDDGNIAYDSTYNLKASTEISKPNWTFDGWEFYGANGLSVLAAGSPQTNMSSVDNSTVELRARWHADNYTITLHQIDPAGNALTANTVTNYTFGTGARLESIAQKIATVNDIGYEWTGWAIGSDRTRIKYYAHGSADDIYNIERTTNIDLYPVWVDRTSLVYVTFDGNGGTINGSSRWTVGFASGSELVYPISSNVKRKGFTHDGWLDDDRTTAFNKTIVDFASGKTIFAKWQPGNYTVEFIAIGDGVVGTMAPQTVNTGVNTSFNPNAYRRAGYRFVGWDTEPQATSVVYGDGQAIEEPLADIGETIRLYTVWSANTYTITYKDKNDNVIGQNSLLYGGFVTLLNNTNIPRGEKDTGFDLEGHAGVHFLSGQTVTGEDLMIDINTDLDTGIVLKGTTEKIVYIVTFDANGGKYPDGRMIATASITWGDSVLAKAPGEPKYTGKTFYGYTVDGVFRDINTITWDYESSMTFKALWEGTLYTIKYNDNIPISPDAKLTNNISGPALATQSALADVNTGLNEYRRTITGYTFVGWATESYAAKESETMFKANDVKIIRSKDGRPATVNFDQQEGDIVELYAVWTRKEYNLTLAQNESKGNVPDPYKGQFTIHYDELLADNPAFSTKTRANYTFSGKFIKTKIDNPYQKKIYNGDYYTLNTVNRDLRDVTLYPLWYNNETEIKMVLNPRDAQFPDSVGTTSFIGYADAPLFIKGADGEPKYSDGSLIEAIATPYEIKIFDYWSTIRGDKNTKITKDTIYDGTYDEIYGNVRLRDEYLLTFDPNGGTGTMDPQTMREGISIDTQLNKFNKSGYSFGGWRDQNGTFYQNGATIEDPSGALQFKAQWNRNGGGGGGTGGAINKGLLHTEGLPEFTLQTPITLDQYRFLLDGAGSPTGILLKKDSVIGKIITSSMEYTSKFKTIVNYPEYVLLRNGFYNLVRTDGPYYYDVDDAGKIRTGFVNVNPLQLYIANTVTNKLVKVGEARGGKYYLLNTTGINRGIIYTLPIVIGNVRYIFDASGRVISETTETKTQWVFNPTLAKWSYFSIDENGRQVFYKNGAYPIKGPDGHTYYYIFDEDGYMMTGFVKYNGKTYYTAESGLLKGAVLNGSQVINGKRYNFDSSGALIMPQLQALQN